MFFPQRLNNIKINGFVTVSAQVFSIENRIKANWPQCQAVTWSSRETHKGNAWMGQGRDGPVTVKVSRPFSRPGKLLNLYIVRDVKQPQEITENTVFSYPLKIWIRVNVLETGYMALNSGFSTFCCCLVAKSCLILVTPMDCTCQAPLSMGFPRQEYWSGLISLSPGDFPNPGFEPMSPALAGGFFTSEPPGKP